MSMVSIKNFISPFTNTVHTVSIILVTILFALFRLQGGGASTTYTKSRPAIETQIEIPTADILEEAPVEARPAAKPVERAPIKSQPAITDSGSIEISGDEEDLLKEMIGQRKAAEAPAQPANRNTKKDATGGLADIEKSLGMR